MDILERLWEDGDRVFCRLPSDEARGDRYAFVATPSGASHPTLESIRRLKHEYELKDYLDRAWALRPLELVLSSKSTMLIVDYIAGEPLGHLIDKPMEIGRFLRIAANLAGALRRLHGCGLIHKDIKPGNILVDEASGQVWLMGFGIASCLPRERQAPEPPELIAGTLAYMAPEQTGRMNRSIDSRSDLYSLGVTFFEMLTGILPFSASDALEWVHCHVARQPVSLLEQMPSVPTAIWAITSKLLSKTGEERYQTAAGVERDLRHCLLDWEARAGIDDFVLGSGDTPDRLIIPEKLYGREREVEALWAAYQRIAAGGRPELVLVSGQSGIGKSAVVQELHKWVVVSGGLFASGKFDQYKRGIPYATLAQALQDLIRSLMGKSEEELCRWRAEFREALEPNAALVLELVPELKHIIGVQPPTPTLSPADTQARFRLTMGRFIGVFARPAHPLVLFVDDLQWLDEGTLELLEDLLSQGDVRHLLLIGAFRNNEIGATHPLARKLEEIRAAGGPIESVALRPLARDGVACLLADCLCMEPKRVAPLAYLIHEKTNGNPLFALQFIVALTDEALLWFDHGSARWTWDLERIRGKDYTENVVELVVAKLTRLSAETRRALQLFACLGNSADFGTLRVVCQVSIEQLHGRLWEAVRAGVVNRSETCYRFLHDRVQEAAYSLIPVEERAAEHLRIGMLLAGGLSPAQIEDAIFEIVNQLNRGSELVASRQSREVLASFNLRAAERAKGAATFELALQYGRTSALLLTEHTWAANYELAFSIGYLVAECEVLTGETAAASDRLSSLARRARNGHDFCRVTRLRLTLHVTLSQHDQAVDVLLDWLADEGVIWSRRPTRGEVMREYDKIQRLLGHHRIEELLDRPLVKDEDLIDAMSVLIDMIYPALLYDENLSSLIVCRLVSLSLEHGNCDESCFAYAWLAIFAGPGFGRYEDSARFAQLACDLIEKRGLARYRARTYLSLGALLIPWTKHLASAREVVKHAFETAHRMGDLTFAATSSDVLISIALMSGVPLVEAQAEAEQSLAFIKKARFGPLIEHGGAKLALIRTLRGLTPTFGRLDDVEFREIETEHRLAGNRNLADAAFFYWTRKLQARFYAGDHGAALGAWRSALQAPQTWPSRFGTAAPDFHLYGALANAAAWTTAAPEDKLVHVEAVKSHSGWFEARIEHNPEAFESRAAMVAAELARVEGRTLAAETLYERAIRSAHGHGLIHDEAVANELAARFYGARGLTRISNIHLSDARYCYLRWGAEAKVRQLDQLYPHLHIETSRPDAAAAIQAGMDGLDLTRAIGISEAVAGEIVLPKLIDALVRTAVEQAGADRGVLVLALEGAYHIEAEATRSVVGLRVTLPHATVTAADMPESVLRFVIRTRQSVLLNDTSVESQFTVDEYVRSRVAQSILCLPILKQARLIGVLYLESRSTRHAFTPLRITILKLLASQAAVSIENANLYHDLARREAKIRRLVDANIIGLMIWNSQGKVLDANEAFLDMVGYGHDDLAAGRLSWRDLTPSEWLEHDERELLPELLRTGRLRPFEKEFQRKDRSRIPVLMGVATFEQGGSEGVAFVLDLTERKRAAEMLRDLHLQLVHASRLATIGQLAASIAHEVSQPIGAAHNNARAALEFLAADAPDLSEVMESLECIVNETYRAGGIIGRIRSHVKRAPRRRERVDVNAAIGDVIALVRGELSKHSVSISTRFDEKLSPVDGDRVELQQVILNLTLNAIEAMDGVSAELRELVISTEERAPFGVGVSFRDTGPGVAPEDLEGIFDAFRTTKPDGLGIGLSISRSIIDSHGGRLSADSPGPRGAVFRFTLPTHQ